MSAFEVLALDPATPQIRAPGGSDTYTFPKAAEFTAAITYGGVTLSNSVTGTGSMVLSASPSFTTPSLGAATATSINKVAFTAPVTGSTLTIADGKTLTANNSLTLAGTDGTTMTFPSTSASIARTDAGQTFTGKQTFTQISGCLLNGNAPALSGNDASIGATGFSIPTGYFGSIELNASNPTSVACLVGGSSAWTTPNLGNGLTVGSNQPIGFTNGSTLVRDVLIFRDAAGVLAQRNATSAQIFRIYNTYTDGSNYERGKIEWSSNVLRIGTEKAGTGTARAVDLQTDGTTRVTLGASGGITLADANNVAVGTTTGTKIGTATTQKLGFWNATPIVQPDTGVAAATVAATGAGDVVAASTTFDGYTIPQIVKALRNAGLLA